MGDSRDVPAPAGYEKIGTAEQLACGIRSLDLRVATCGGNHDDIRITRALWGPRSTVLRKTCGTRIADGGGGVAHLRHKDLQTVSRYIDRRGAGSCALAALER